MIDIELDPLLKHSVIPEQNLILREYGEIAENLRHNINLCREEQNNIRSQLETLKNENKNATDKLQECFSQIHVENCFSDKHEKDMITNLQERNAVLQMEKDSAVQLWQVALKAVDALEEDLKAARVENRSTKIYEEEVNNVRETYSEAIRALEVKLLQAKENVLKQQSLWESSKETIINLNKDKENANQKLLDFQKESFEKDRQSQQTIESLKAELAVAKSEIQKMNFLKAELESRLNETKRYAANIVARDEEAKSKVAEAVELVDIAVREKEAVLQRDAFLLQEKTRLEHTLSVISEEHQTKLQNELKRMKEAHERDIKKYLLEIKELKTEMRQKATFIDRTQREQVLAEEELEKYRQNYENLLHTSNAKISELEQKLKYAETELQMKEEASKKKYNTAIKELEERVAELEAKLIASNEKILKIQQDDCYNMDVQARKITDKTRDAFEAYTNLETRLAKTLDEKENLAKEIGSLQSAFNHEMQKRDHERNLLQNKIHELELSLQKATYSAEEASKDNLFSRQLFSLKQQLNMKDCTDANAPGKDHCCQSVLSEQLDKLQERYDKKIKELAEHVEVHQKLSKKWQEEAKSLTAKFQTKSKELRMKINALRQENDELNKELLACRQQLAQYRVQAIHRYNHGSETR